jgi:hypothetical protein
LVPRARVLRVERRELPALGELVGSDVEAPGVLDGGDGSGNAKLKLHVAILVDEEGLGERIVFGG